MLDSVGEVGKQGWGRWQGQERVSLGMPWGSQELAPVRLGWCLSEPAHPGRAP